MSDKISHEDPETALRLIVAGPKDWREPAVARLQTDERFVVIEEIEADINGVDIARIPAADVLVSTVDPQFAAPAIKLALALQNKIYPLSVVFVLPPMYRDELQNIEGYRSVWSLVATDTCEDAEMFAEAVWSASRGITWVDPAMYRRLNEVRAVSAHRSTPVAGFEE